MSLKSYLFFILAVFVCNSTLAQQQKISYFKDNGREVRSRDSADYVRVISKDDTASNLFNVVESYKNGKPKTVGRSSKLTSVVWEGECLFFYPTGKKHWVANYKNGRLRGSDVEFYPNGVVHWEKEYLADIVIPAGNGVGNSLRYHYLTKTCNDSTGKALLTNGDGKYIGYFDNYKKISEQGPVKNGERTGQWTGRSEDKDSVLFKEEYDNGKLIAGTSVDKAGKNYTYTEREIQPQFTGGEKAFARFLSEQIRYPKMAKENNIQGRVFVTFVIDTDGKLVDMKVTRAPNNDLAAESVRVLNLSPPWVPGIQYGRAVRVQYTVPINYALQ